MTETTANFVTYDANNLQVHTPDNVRFEDGLFVRAQVIDGSVEKKGNIKNRAYYLKVHLRSGTTHRFKMQGEAAAFLAAEEVRAAVIKRPAEKVAAKMTPEEYMAHGEEWGWD